jgi:putative tryptophan/tyrosine transport system substrate-binding protein
MNRRAFITLLGGTAIARPMAARAQQAMKRIGIIMAGLAGDAEVLERIAALRKGLQDLGWMEGRNYRFEYRWPGSDTERIRAQAAELVALAPDMIVAGTIVGALAMKELTRSIPIVFMNMSDPVGNGLVSSLARPGANVTGFAAYEDSIAGKWLELLKEIAPRTTRVGYVFGTEKEFGPNGELFHRVLQATTPAFSVELTALRIRSVAEIDPTIDRFASAPNGGLIAAAEAGAMRNRSTIIAAAARHRMPAVYPFRFCAADGGLAAYGVDFNDQYRRAASYADRILKGANPADLPVQAPDKFELIINLKSAKAQGIEIPPLLLTRADELIE